MVASETRLIQILLKYLVIIANLRPSNRSGFGRQRPVPLGVIEVSVSGLLVWPGWFRL